MIEYGVSNGGWLLLRWSGWKAYILLGVVAFSLSAIGAWIPDYGWHEQQRIFQIVLLCVVSLLSPFILSRFFSNSVWILLLVFFLMGLVSSFMANYTSWALKEWALYVGLVLLALVVAELSFDRLMCSSFLAVMVLVGALHAGQFLAFYCAAFLSGIKLLLPVLLLDGFSHLRHMGQFQLLLFPILGGSIYCLRGRHTRLACFLFFILVVQWCMAYLSGGRGLWVGLLAGYLSLLLLSVRWWGVIALQLIAAVSGFILFFLMFKVIPYFWGGDVALREVLKAGLSSREHLWRWAFEMTVANPFFGVGPMHFSASPNPVAAHPHQTLLQLSAEWGVVAAFLVLMLIVLGFCRGAAAVRRDSASVLDAGLWVSLLGAFVLAQVDGVLVMPYGETWLAILVGIAISRWGRLVRMKNSFRVGLSMVACSVLLVLGQVVVFEVPQVPERQELYFDEHQRIISPRFWLQGWIPWD